MCSVPKKKPFIWHWKTWDFRELNWCVVPGKWIEGDSTLKFEKVRKNYKLIFGLNFRDLSYGNIWDRLKNSNISNKLV